MLSERALQVAHEAYRREGLSGLAHDAQLRAGIQAYITALAEDEETVERVANALDYYEHAGLSEPDSDEWIWARQQARAVLKALAEDGAP